jgi:hypothetical protein
MILPNRLTEEQTHDADVDYRGKEEAREKKERSMQSLVSFHIIQALWRHHILSETRTPRGLRVSILMTYGEAMKLIELLKKTEVKE